MSDHSDQPPPESAPKLAVVPNRVVKLGPIAEASTGYTVKAMTQKIDRGIWLEGYEYHTAPDGRRQIDLDGVQLWARGQRRKKPDGDRT